MPAVVLDTYSHNRCGSAVAALSAAYDEHKHKLEEVSNEYDRVSNELTSVQNELKTTADRIDELNSKDALTITEKGELSNLRASNEELEKRIRWIRKRKGN